MAIPQDKLDLINSAYEKVEVLQARVNNMWGSVKKLRNHVDPGNPYAESIEWSDVSAEYLRQWTSLKAKAQEAFEELP